MEWMENLDRRVNLTATAIEDIRGLVRVRTSRLCRGLRLREGSGPQMETTRAAAKPSATKP